MKKSLFYWAFLAFVGMSLTACSSGDDNIADNTTPATPDTQNKTVILTGTIGVGGDETRAVDNDGKTSWKANDPITINYENTSGGYSRATGTISEVSSDKHFATFTATLTEPKDDGYIGFAYGTVNSADPNNAYDFTFNYSAYYNDQDGTTEGISSSRLDYACTEEGGEVKMAVKDSKATLKSTALLKNQFSMFEFTLVKEGATSTNVPATKLEIWVGSSTFASTPKYTINSAATSKFYVALEPTADNATIDGVKIVASFNNQDAAKKLDADGVTAMETGDEGNYICVDESAGTNQYQAYIYPSLENPKVCEHTYGTSKFVKGKLYSADLTVKDLTPVAVIAHVGAVTGYWDNFLALALKDATSGTVSVSSGKQYAEDFASGHSAKINRVTYDKVAARGSEESEQPYDRVYDNIFGETTPNTNFSDWTTSAPSTSALKGWRIPTVTDWRYILSYFGARDADKPKGIGDHNARYPTALHEISSTTAIDYYQGSSTERENFVSSINTACGNPSTDYLQLNYYWTGSQLDKDQEDLKDQGTKIWRYNFSSGVFEWNSGGNLGDNSNIRLVLAY